MTKSKTPKLVNAFKDEATGINFIIPGPKQRPRPEAEKMARDFITKARQDLFDTWKKRPANKNWTGDIESKKSELFAKRYSPGSEMILSQSND